MVGLLERPLKTTAYLVCLDLRLGQEVARIDTGVRAENSVIAVQKLSLHSFRVALAELYTSNEGDW